MCTAVTAEHDAVPFDVSGQNASKRAFYAACGRACPMRRMSAGAHE